MSDAEKGQQATCANCGATVRRGQGLMKKADEGWVCAVCLRLPAILARLEALEAQVRELQGRPVPGAVQRVRSDYYLKRPDGTLMHVVDGEPVDNAGTVPHGSLAGLLEDEGDGELRKELMARHNDG